MIVGPTAETMTTSVASLPIIDFRNFINGSPGQRERAVAEINRACREHGMFYLRNHGVATETVSNAFDVLKAFFALPAEEKKRVAPRWHNDIESETEHFNFREGYRLGLLANDHPLVSQKMAMSNLWPTRPSDFQRVMVEYGNAMRCLGQQILQSIALALGMDESFFLPYFSHGSGKMHPLYYPLQPGVVDKQRVGLRAHTDFGAITILAQDNHDGLQVVDSDGTWLAVPPLEGTFVVNLGQLMVRWTNNAFVCAKHRVVNTSGAERYSIPCFYDADPEAVVTCVPSCVAPGASVKYPPISVTDYVESCYPGVSKSY